VQVTALLVSHNGARWLPAVVDGVAKSTYLPDSLLAVDTGSTDESASILRAAGWRVGVVSTTTSYVDAVKLALPDITTEWVWLLHDDSNPDPEALELLLAASQQHPGAQIFGPKLREWPSLRRLLELGVTISGTARRENGLERGEYDQGQHDDQREALAVNTAGMLVRREVLATVGFDAELPIYGNDIDFGWRAAKAGYRTIVVPEAVVFHVEAAARGVRDGELADHSYRRQREAGLYTLLVNGSARGLPWRFLRLFFGSLIRVVGNLLVRSPREALGELGAVLSTVGRPWRILRGRMWRHRRIVTQSDAVRTAMLLPPWWLPYRHGLDAVADFFSALLSVGRDTAARSNGQSLAHEDDELGAEQPGLIRLLLRNPLVWLFIASFTLAAVAARGDFGGHLWGGALPAAPETTGWWWSTYWSGNHTLGTGSSAPAPTYLVPLMALSALLGDHPAWAISTLFLLSVPLTVLSALRFLRRLITSRIAALWGAAAYGLLPLATGAVAQGRLGTVVAALLLPWVATSALPLLGPDPDRRWRAAWRTGLGGALLTAFVPPMYPFALLLGLGLIGWSLTKGATVRVWPLVAALVSVPVLLLPWVAGVGTNWSAWLIEAGRADIEFVKPSALNLLSGQGAGEVGAPWWLVLPIMIAGSMALARGDKQRGVRGAWIVALIGAVFALVLVLLPVHLPGMPSVSRAWPGAFLIFSYSGIVTAAAIGGDGLRVWIRSGAFSWRQALVALGAVAGLLGVVGLTGWWVTVGLPGPVQHQPVTGVPRYMTELAYGRDDNAVLVVQGDAQNGVNYRVLRHGPWRVGDEAIAMLTPPDDQVTAMVASLFSSKQLRASAQLADYGISYVYVPAPARGAITGALDASTSLSRASAARARDAAWRVRTDASTQAIDRTGQPLRRTLIGLQILFFITVLVMAAPSRRRQS